jgi:hypothetical protein
VSRRRADPGPDRFADGTEAHEVGHARAAAASERKRGAPVEGTAENAKPMIDRASSRCDVRRAAVEDAHAVHAVRQRAIRESAAGLYDRDALEAWASGGLRG